MNTIDALQTENERLREENAMLKQHIGVQYASEQAAETELLRKEAHRHVLAIQQKDGLILDQEEQIERLREEKAALIAAKVVTINLPPMPEGEMIDYLRQTIDRQNQDISQLRRENADLASGWQRTYDHDCKRNQLLVEIEQLRGENDALKDEVELKAAALTGTSRVMGEEIERLRGLLRDFLAEHDSYEMHKRVREELGNETL